MAFILVYARNKLTRQEGGGSPRVVRCSLGERAQSRCMGRHNNSHYPLD